MAKDYVSRSKPKKRPAKGRANQAPSGRFPLVKALLILAVIGLFAFGLYSIKGTAPEPVIPPSVEQNKAKPKPKAQLPEPPKEREYVAELEGKSVEVEAKPKPLKPKRPYQMQCASFRSYAKAEESKALIAFAGQESQIRKTTGQNGTWYRVVLGPFATKRDAERVRHTLQNAKINGCQIWHWNWD